MRKQRKQRRNRTRRTIKNMISQTWLEFERSLLKYSDNFMLRLHFCCVSIITLKLLASNFKLTIHYCNIPSIHSISIINIYNPFEKSSQVISIAPCKAIITELSFLSIEMARLAPPIANRTILDVRTNFLERFHSPFLHALLDLSLHTHWWPLRKFSLYRAN